MNIILFGFKGCGKTHFGKKLAELIHRPFIDLDNVLEAVYFEENNLRLKTGEIYQLLGEQRFRQLEKRALLCIYGIELSVIALGGGTVLDRDNVDLLLKMGQLVYLKTSFQSLQKRLPQTFPLLEGTSLQSLYHSRIPFYASVPSRIIDTDLLDEAGILASLQSIACLEEPPNGF